MGLSTKTPSSSSRLAHWAAEYAEDLQRFLAKRGLLAADRKDVCQEVYLRLLRFDRTEIVANPQAYLFRVAANVAHDFNLRQRRRLPLDSQSFDETESAPGPEEIAEAASRKKRITQALESLPPLARAAIALQAREDLTYEDIAQRLGASRRTVKRAIARGYALMRIALKDLE